MYIILVHWLIKDSEHHEKAFLAAWEKMKVDPNSGLFREILTKPRRQNDAKFNTFSLTDKAYRTFVNVGIWKDVESFDAAISKYIQGAELRKPEKGPKKDRRKQVVIRPVRRSWF